MKRTNLLLSFLALLLVCAQPCFAYTIDGHLDDWGVTPFTDWAPPSNSTIDSNIEDNHSHPDEWPRTISFREQRDLEALYFDDDANYIYWALVSSVPFNDPRISPRPEDMALDLNGDGIHEFGLDIAYIDPQTGEGIAPEVRDVYSVTEWYTETGADYRVKTFEDIGDYEIFNRYLGNIEPGPPYGQTYVIEARVAKALFGNLGASAEWDLFLAKYECITDYISVPGTAGGQDIPEPGSFLLFGLALAMAGLAKKRTRSE